MKWPNLNKADGSSWRFTSSPASSCRERPIFGLRHHNLSWGSCFDSKPMIISFQCKQAARDVSTIIPSPVTETQQRRATGAEPGKEACPAFVTFTVSTIKDKSSISQFIWLIIQRRSKHVNKNSQMMIKGEEEVPASNQAIKRDRESEGWTPSPPEFKQIRTPIRKWRKLSIRSKQERISLNEKQPLNIGYKMTWWHN